MNAASYGVRACGLRGVASWGGSAWAAARGRPNISQSRATSLRALAVFLFPTLGAICFKILFESRRRRLY